MPDSYDIRPVATEDHSDWLTLWERYLVFYESTLPEATTVRLWQRLQDPEHPFRGFVAVDTNTLGGGSRDFGSGIDVDRKNAVHIVGSTESADFPTASPLQDQLDTDGNSIFVAKLDARAGKLLFSPSGAVAGSTLPVALRWIERDPSTSPATRRRAMIFRS